MPDSFKTLHSAQVHVRKGRVAKLVLGEVCSAEIHLGEGLPR